MGVIDQMRFGTAPRASGAQMSIKVIPSLNKNL